MPTVCEIESTKDWQQFGIDFGFSVSLKLKGNAPLNNVSWRFAPKTCLICVQASSKIYIKDLYEHFV